MNIPRAPNMCLEVVALARKISGDLVLWVEGPIILLNEGMYRDIALTPFGSPLWPGLPSLLGGIWWGGVELWHHIDLLDTSLAESQFSHL